MLQFGEPDLTCHGRTRSHRIVSSVDCCESFTATASLSGTNWWHKTIFMHVVLDDLVAARPGRLRIRCTAQSIAAS